MIETFVAAGCRCRSAGRAAPSVFATTARRVEVDFVLEGRAGEIVAIEVKSGYIVTGHDFKSLRALAEAAGRRFPRGIVLYTGPEMLPFGTNLHALPLSTLWGR
jgi:predicted AAA+ superfamily ATPase